MSNPKVKIRRKNVEKILLAAEKVFAEQGYAGTKMADIALQAALPRSNLHYYFSTKDELYRIADDIDQPLGETLKRALAALRRELEVG